MEILVVGLGNPGEKYSGNRHNIGFMVIDRLAETKKISINKNKFKSSYGSGLIDDSKIHLIKPETYMNKSGEAVKEIKNFFKIPVENIIVIHDEMDLPLGKVKIKSGGGTAGHKGLNSIAADLGTRDFTRIRIGVDKPENKNRRTGFLLSDFSPDEKEAVNESIQKAADAVVAIICNDLSTAMNKFN